MHTTITSNDTLVTLLPSAVERHGDRVAARHRDGAGWRDVSYAEVGDVVTAIALGLIELGVSAGERVAILAATRPEWTYADCAISMAGGVVVPVYPTNSPEECEWVLRDSDAVAVICENAAQVEKVLSVRARLPRLRTIISIEPADGTVDLDEVIAHARTGDHRELERRAEAVRADDPYTFIYTSGTTGPPKGCVLSHGNFRAVLDMIRERNLLAGPDDTTYLFLPLAHALALIMQLSSIEAGGAIAYSGGDPRAILPELAEVAPTFLPSVPRIFEKVYAAVTGDVDPSLLQEAVRIGASVENLRRRGVGIPADLQTAYRQFDERLFSRVRGAFGGRLRLAVTGAAPVAPQILEFFWACGVPVMEGYGMTETASAISICTLEEHRFGTVGKPLPGVDVRIAEDGEILVRGANVFGGYHKRADTTSFGAVEDGWLHTGDLGAIDDDGYLSITGRTKDIIITAGGKNLAPANLENDLKQSPWISHAVMHGDRRPYPVMLITLDEEQMRAWAQHRGLSTDIGGEHFFTVGQTVTLGRAGHFKFTASCTNPSGTTGAQQVTFDVLADTTAGLDGNPPQPAGNKVNIHTNSDQMDSTTDRALNAGDFDQVGSASSSTEIAADGQEVDAFYNDGVNWPSGNGSAEHGCFAGYTGFLG